MSCFIVADGEPWEGKLSLNVRRSMDMAFHEFEFTTTDRYQEGVGRWNVAGGSNIQIYWKSEKIFDGFVNEYDPSFAPGSHTVRVAGESHAADLVEFGHEGPYFWKNVAAESIISDVLTPYGMSVDISKPLRPIGAEGFRVAVDDTAFNIVQKIAENNGLTTFTGNDGRLKMSDGSGAPLRAQMTTGFYPVFRAKHRVSSAPSRLIVKSQKNVKTVGSESSASFNAVQRHERVLINEVQPRYRPLVIIHNGEIADVDDFSTYASRRFTGDSVSAFIQVKDVVDPNGDLWGIEQLVPILEPAGDLNETLIVSTYELSVSEGGGLTVGLTLREPRSYSGEASTISRRQTIRRQSGLFGRLLGGLDV